MVFFDVNPCWSELSDDFSRVSAVLGPRDLAPLALEVADFNSEVIIFLSYLGVYTEECGENR
jgi:hypothetical protein